MNILITLLVSVVSVFTLNNFVPLKYLDFPQKEKNLGATITIIQGSDTLSSSRTVINTNFANLNADKFDVASTSHSNLTTASALETVGTIISGTWNGGTITVPYGGTGSTTLSSNSVLLGNGIGNIKTVDGLGTSGQSLVSNGVGSAPTWQSVGVNQADNFTWTGTHLFTASSTHSATTTISANSTTNNALVLNGINYAFPASESASSTVLMTNGSGSLSWNETTWKLLTSTTTEQAMGIATTTITGTPQDLRIIYFNPNTMSGADSYFLAFNGSYSGYGFSAQEYGGAGPVNYQQSNNTYIRLTEAAVGTTSPAYITIDVKNVASKIKRVVWNASVSSSGTNAPSITNGAGNWNDTSNSISSIQIGNPFGGLGAGTAIPAGATIQVYGSNN